MIFLSLLSLLVLNLFQSKRFMDFFFRRLSCWQCKVLSIRTFIYQQVSLLQCSNNFSFGFEFPEPAQILKHSKTEQSVLLFFVKEKKCSFIINFAVLLDLRMQKRDHKADLQQSVYTIRSYTTRSIVLREKDYVMI